MHIGRRRRRVRADVACCEATGKHPPSAAIELAAQMTNNYYHLVLLYLYYNTLAVAKLAYGYSSPGCPVVVLLRVILPTWKEGIWGTIHKRSIKS